MLTSYLLAAAVALAASTTAQGTEPSSSTSTPTPAPAPTSTSSSQPTSTGKGKIIEISVGAYLHQFSPDNVTANVGDIIRFNFYPGGHRVARAEYKQPCIPYEYTGANKHGFYSGVFNPQVISDPLPHYDVTVNDTDTIFFYCGAPGSCIQYGMIGVINPTKEKTLETQKLFAANATLQLVPGDPWPSETLSTTSTPTSTPAPGSAGSANSQTGSPDPQPQSSGSSGLSAGAIAGIAIGAAAVIILGAALIYLCGRRGGFETAYRKSVNAAHPGLSHPGIPGAMVESKYHDPKSPGQATMSTFSHTERDPYRVSTQTGYMSGPPPSPGMNGHSSYQSPVVNGAHFNPSDMHNSGQYRPSRTSPNQVQSPQFQSPIELPTAEDPTRRSPPPPPPQYPHPQAERRDSLTTGQEGYHPGKQ